MADIKPGPNQLIIANELLSGRAVFFAGDRGWSSDPGRAVFANSKDEAEALLDAARKDEAANQVVGVELIGGELRDGKPYPTRNREIMRVGGPSVHTDHGYQAGN